MPISTRLLRDLCALPTAAFLEDAVYAYVDAWCARRPELRVATDRFGNRLLTLPGTDRKAPRFVLVAHTDHPAFVSMLAPGRAPAGTGRREVHAEFRGGVAADHAEGARVRFFTPSGEVTATILHTRADENGRLIGAELRARGEVPSGCVGMFDFAGLGERGDAFRARACDDLAGVASALQALDQLRRKPPATTVCVLLTRAEEVGFIGAIAAANGGRGSLLKRGDRLLSIETSMEQPVAVRGKGVVLRVGDYTSVFNSALSYYLFEQAQALAKRDATFAFQRALMPGGTCEATAFDAFGHLAAAVCVPLGNYHNMDRARRRTGPETISVSDWRRMVTLFVAAARAMHTFDGKSTRLRERLQVRFEGARHLFADPRLPLHR